MKATAKRAPLRLRDFLTANRLSMPADFAWTDDPKTSQALVAALVRDPTARSGCTRSTHPCSTWQVTSTTLSDSPLTPSFAWDPYSFD